MYARCLSVQQMPTALVTSQKHLKFQKLNTTISNRREMSYPAIFMMWANFLSVQRYTVEHKLLFWSPNLYLPDENSDGNWAKKPWDIPQPPHETCSSL